MSIAFAVGRQTHAALATAEFCVRTTPSSLGLQARPACSANVQSVHEFHATPAICMRRAAPLSSLRASQAQSRDARRETRTLRKRRVKSTYLLTSLLSHSRGTPLSHPHCPVGQLRSRVVGPEYVGHRWWGQGGGKVGRGRGGGVLLLYSPGGLPVGIPVSSPFPVLLLLAPASLLST